MNYKLCVQNYIESNMPDDKNTDNKLIGIFTTFYDNEKMRMAVDMYLTRFEIDKPKEPLTSDTVLSRIFQNINLNAFGKGYSDTLEYSFAEKNYTLKINCEPRTFAEFEQDEQPRRTFIRILDEITEQANNTGITQKEVCIKLQNLTPSERVYCRNHIDENFQKITRKNVNGKSGRPVSIFIKK